MKEYDMLVALGEINDKFILDAKDCGDAQRRKVVKLRRTVILVAVIAAILALCAFAAGRAWWDMWLQESSTDPLEVVRSAIENEKNKDYTIFVSIEELVIDYDETERVVGLYTGSVQAESRGWSDEYLAEHFIVVRALYDVEYDHTKTFLSAGKKEQNFYLAEDIETGRWKIVDNDSGSIIEECDDAWTYLDD